MPTYAYGCDVRPALLVARVLVATAIVYGAMSQLHPTGFLSAVLPAALVLFVDSLIRNFVAGFTDEQP